MLLYIQNVINVECSTTTKNKKKVVCFLLQSLVNGTRYKTTNITTTTTTPLHNYDIQLLLDENYKGFVTGYVIENYYDSNQV